jgi:hypothetical protein
MQSIKVINAEYQDAVINTKHGIINAEDQDNKSKASATQSKA